LTDPLILARALTPATRAAIAALERRTVAIDGGRLKLEWGSLDALTERSPGPPRLALWSEAGRIVGFVGRYAFGGADIAELAGMVDPGHRRRGIGSKLLDAALEHADGHPRVLLVVPRNGAGGDAFARAHGGRLHHSEHALVLRSPPRLATRIDAVSLRRAGPADADVVGDLVANVFGVRPGDLAAELAGPDGRTHVVLFDGEPIGTLRLSLRDGRGGVYGFAIDPGWRGRGIGRDVLARSCSLLRAAGAREIGLEVLTENEHALGLYTSIGFEPVITEDYYELQRMPSPT
jgi:ribosomal protein S18 acetylase RimI-like enzyme